MAAARLQLVVIIIIMSANEVLFSPGTNRIDVGSNSHLNTDPGIL